MRTYSGTAFLRESKERPGGAAPHGRAFSLTVLYKSGFSIYNNSRFPRRRPLAGCGETEFFDRTLCLWIPKEEPGLL